MCRSCPEYLQLLGMIPKIPGWFNIPKHKWIPEPKQPDYPALPVIRPGEPELESLVQKKRILIDQYFRDSDAFITSHSLWREAMKVLRYLEWRVFYTDEMFKLLYPGKFESCSITEKDS